MVPFQDPENVGAVVRSAAAFGAAQVILLAESAHPFHPKALRASGGAALAVILREGPSLSEIPDELPILSLSAEGTPLQEAEFPPAFGLLAGMEGPGPARALAPPQPAHPHPAGGGVAERRGGSECGAVRVALTYGLGIGSS